MRADSSPRLFEIDMPVIDCFFSGAGDMFAALMTVRLREAATTCQLLEAMSWLSPDSVEAVNLPLAKAAEKALGSISTILRKTKTARDEALERMGGEMGILELEKGSQKRLNLRKTKAAEVRIARYSRDLQEPEEHFKAKYLRDEA